MDRTEEDIKDIGFFGVFKQSHKAIFSCKKIFAQITFVFILPLAIIFAVHRKISNRIFWRTETTAYVLFTIAYFIFLTVFSLLATAAIVFTVASIYTGREVAFRNVIKVIPKVWKRLCITFVFLYIAQFTFDVIATVAMAIPLAILGYSILGVLISIIILILSVYGFLYLSVVCQLASVATVLENIHGFEALRKGKDLANGKKKVGMRIAFALYGILVGLIVVYMLFVEYGHETYRLALIWRLMIGILCGILLLMLFLVFMVTQTVFYLVCKSYHREAIDKLCLSTFLGAYMAETVVYPGVGVEIQLGRTQPPTQQV